jgi:hypothetical protein
MTMLLKGRNDTEFELSFIEDRFPDLQDDAGDSAWVTLLFRAAVHDEAWEETAPCLNVFELQSLVEWLEAVAGSRHEVSEIDLPEPNLSFSIAHEFNGEVTIRVGFRLEGRSEQPSFDTQADRDHVDIRLPRSQLRVAAAELRRDLETTFAHVSASPFDDDEDSGMLGSPEANLGLMPGDIIGYLEDGGPDRKF